MWVRLSFCCRIIASLFSGANCMLFFLSRRILSVGHRYVHYIFYSKHRHIIGELWWFNLAFSFLESRLTIHVTECRDQYPVSFRWYLSSSSCWIWSAMMCYYLLFCAQNLRYFHRKSAAFYAIFNKLCLSLL